MKSAVFLAILVLGGTEGVEAQNPDRAADQLALTCLSEGPALVVAGLAVGRESPNGNAAMRTSRIADICRSARMGLQHSDHVCLTMVSNGERLADQLSQVYSGRVPVSDFLATSSAAGSFESEDDQRLEANAQCEARMLELTRTTTGENQ